MIAAFRYSTEFLGETVGRRGMLVIEQAIRMLTGEPARLYGMVGRSEIAVGSHADLVVRSGRDTQTATMDL